MSFVIIKLTLMPDGSFEDLDTDRKWMPVPAATPAAAGHAPIRSRTASARCGRGNAV